jgi:hypothetical protein
LGKALAKTCLSLKNLSASFHIDAKDFFPTIWPNVGNWREEVQKTHHYPNLENLSLTAATVCGPRPAWRRCRLLVAAGVAALYHMPKLKVMELWDFVAEEGRTHDWVFRFELEPQLRITFMAVFDVEAGFFDPVFEAWRWMVRDIRPGQTLEIKRERWQGHWCYRQTLRNLKLRRGVVNPVSYDQILDEGRAMCP